MNTQLPTHAVKAVIVNEADEILFVQRNPRVRESDSWDLPGGLVEDETEEDALKREVREELGVEIEVLSKIGEWHFLRPADGKEVTVTNFACRVLSGDITLSTEHIDYRWVPKAAARELVVKNPSLFEALG